MDGEAGALVGVFAALSGDGDLLERERDAGENAAALEDGGAVAEDEVDGAVDVTLAVELPEGVGVEGVLVPFYAAPEERRLVRVHTEGHRLVVLRPCSVPERHVPCYEPLPGHGCTL